MDISIFLAKLIGLYFLICALLCIFRKKQMEQTCKEVMSTKSVLAVSAEISLIFGLVIAIDHSIWEVSYRGLITVLGYLMILRGIIRFAFPAYVKKFCSKMGKGHIVCSIITLAIGVYLTYVGFTYG
ncbi:MAG TPA: hypothetical protein VLG76_05435 [Rhabdochlamydiaceae bacterium]|nr:hypothetical protein [Rhabdochlamydiaceae bacterium]